MNNFLHYLTFGYFWEGLVLALEIAAVSFVVGMALALVIAMLRESRVAPFRSFAWFYVWVFRGTPPLLQLIFVFDALPSFGITISAIPTAIIALGLNDAAFQSEIIRGGIHSVDRQQVLGAEALGLTRIQVMRHIVLPQAMRAMIPTYGNQVISLIKATSLASVIAVNEVMSRAQQVAGANFQFFPVFSAVAAMYLVVTTAMTRAQVLLERRFSAARTTKQARRGGWAWLPGRKLGPSGVPTVTFGGSAPLPDGTGHLSTGHFEWEVAPPEERPHVERNLQPVPLRHDGSEIASDGMRGDELLVCRDVTKSYATTPVLKGVSFTVGSGEVLSLMGPSGSGKSTLLRLINHLDDFEAGEILLNGRSVGYQKDGDRLRPVRNLAKARAEARVGLVFQQFNLFQNLSVAENIMLALRRVYGLDPAAARNNAKILLARVGLADLGDALPNRLSGGQQQRVAIARALATEPVLLLLDEPTSALDPELKGEVRHVIRELAESGMTMIVATHDIQFARQIATRSMFLYEGMIVEEGPSSTILRAPTMAATRQFLSLIEDNP